MGFLDVVTASGLELRNSLWRPYVLLLLKDVEPQPETLELGVTCFQIVSVTQLIIFKDVCVWVCAESPRCFLQPGPWAPARGGRAACWRAP